MADRVLNVGLVGGGGGAFIAHPHEKSIHMDGTRRVTCAALHPDPAIAMKEAADWPYSLRGYPSYQEMIEKESRKPEGERIDYILVVTPNNVHYEPSRMALEAGIPVFCEKPLTVTLGESDSLVKMVNDKKIPFCVAHTYLGHWTSRLARHIVRSGLLGEVRWVDVHYLQGWMAGRVEDTGSVQAEWRVDPKKNGISLCGGDIGTHAMMQLRYVTGLEVPRIQAFLETFVRGRRLDDHFTAYCELSNGGKAIIRTSQISIGHKNDMGIEVNGEKGSLRWEQEDPECIRIFLSGQPDRTYWRGQVAANDGFLGDLPEGLLDEPTVPSGHPEGFHDAFGRLHRFFEEDVRAWQAGTFQGSDGSKYATVEDGRFGIAFLVAAVESSGNDHVWIKIP